jgi:hypothetical protein
MSASLVKIHVRETPGVSYPLSNARASQPCIHSRQIVVYEGGTIVQVAASHDTSSKLCSALKPIALSPSKFPSPSICNRKSSQHAIEKIHTL